MLTSRFLAIISSSSFPPVTCLSCRCLHILRGGYNPYLPEPNYDYTNHRKLLDQPYKYVNDNSKVVAVEGHIGVGKADFAKKIAEEFGFFYVPEVDVDDMYALNCNGKKLDMRVINPLLPNDLQFYDAEHFWNDPDPMNQGRPGGLARRFLGDKLWNYHKAMSKLWATGRGLSMVRGPHSNSVMIEAFHRMGLMSNKCFDWYTYFHKMTQTRLFPHLIIYLKAPISYVEERLSQSDQPFERSSVNMTRQFFEIYQELLESKYLETMKKYTEVKVIDIEDTDWTTRNGFETIIMDIANINLDGYEYQFDYEVKWRKWRDIMRKRDMVFLEREKNTTPGIAFLKEFFIREVAVIPEVELDCEAVFNRTTMLMQHPDWQVDPFCNPDVVGWKFALFGLSELRDTWHNKNCFHIKELDYSPVVPLREPWRYQSPLFPLDRTYSDEERALSMKQPYIFTP